jgi:5,10-methylenetetrahydrofolate reductase
MVVRLNHGRDIGGQSTGAPTRFHVGVGVNPFSPNLDAEWRRLDHKVEAGAEFIVTPPILDVAAFEPLLPRLVETRLPILGGVVALEGVRHAEFLMSEVVGVRIPDSLFERLRRAADPVAEATAAMVDVVMWLRERVQGIQVTTVHGTPRTAERLLTEIGRRLGLPSAAEERSRG